MRKFYALAITLLISVSQIFSYSQSVGLVLSGGGAKGIAHIGVLQALEDNNIPIDYITGTSMGAIVGGLYAAGYTPNEMMQLIQSKGFANWSQGIIDASDTYYYDKPEATPEIMRFNLALKDSTKITSSIIPTSLINPLPMNIAFMELFSATTAACDGNFNDLYVPFRCVASDVYNKRAVIWSSGSLGDAIRTSMSFPLVFKALVIDGIPMYDGGIYDNFPVDVMRNSFSPDMMIGVVVSNPDNKPKVNDMFSQIEEMVIQNNDYSLPEKDGVRLVINLKQYGILDFPKAKAIYKIGYDYAMSKMDSIKSRVPRRVSQESRELARRVFKSKIPEVVFDSVIVNGTEKADQAEYIKHEFRTKNNKPLDLQQARKSYYKTISDGKIKDLVPLSEFDPKTDKFKLNLNANVRDNVSVGVGGYLTSSTNSMIFASINYRTMSYNSLDLDINGWVGQSYNAGMFNAKIAPKMKNSMYLRLQGVMSKQKFYDSDVLFYEDNLPTFITSYENFVKLKLGMAATRNGILELSLGYGALKDRFYPTNITDYSSTVKSEAKYKLAQASLLFERTTLNDKNYPSKGYFISSSFYALYGSDRFLNNNEINPFDSGSRKKFWIEANIKASKYFSLGKEFSIGVMGQAVAAFKPLYNDYTATIIQAPAFTPTPHSKNYFNPAFHANKYVAAGIIPIWKMIDNLQLRTEFYAFAPMQMIYEAYTNESSLPYYGPWFNKLSAMGEMSLVYTFSFAALSVYGNYYSYPARNWNFGVSFGLMIHAPKFIRN